MASTLENLRRLSSKHSERVKKAQEIAENMKRVAEAAGKAAAEAKGEKE